MSKPKNNALLKPSKLQSDRSDDYIPNLFATIHFRSERRPDGYTSDEIELLNIEANRHIPDLYEKLKAAREERLARETAKEPYDGSSLAVAFRADDLRIGNWVPLEFRITEAI